MPDTDNKTLVDTALDASLSTQKEDRIAQYKILLGDKIMAEIGQTLGEEGTNRFLELHAKFDRLVEQNPELDIVNLIPIEQVGNYTSFTEYLGFLRKLHEKLAAMANSANNKADKDNAVNQITDTLSEMLEMSAQMGDIATAGASSPRFGEVIFQPLIKLPIAPKTKKLLPKSYPDFTEVSRYVHSRAEQAEFNVWLISRLNSLVKTGLERLTEQKNIMEETRDNLGPKDYLVELQKFLMDNGWIGYSKDEVKEAAAATREITRAGYTTDLNINKGKNALQLDIDALKSHAYLYLGVNLTRELRNAIYRLADSTNKNYNIDGKQAGMDVLMAASAAYVQDFARQWLVKLLKVFNDVEAKDTKQK